MQKNLIIVLLVLVTVAINVVISNFLIEKNNANATPQNIVVVDKTELLKELSANGDKVQTIRDYNNIMTYLRSNGFLVVNKRHVLAHSSQYDLPSMSMPFVEVMLRKKGIPLMTEAEAQSKLDMASNILKKDFNLQH